MKLIKSWALTALAIAMPLVCVKAQQVLDSLASGPPGTNIRALSAVSDAVVWASGSGGYVGRTLNGGASWNWVRIPGAETLDFRSLAALDSLHAVAANAGFPASIYRTTDGGRHWKRVYTGRDSTFFLDGIRFSNAREGIVYGDPVKTAAGKSRFLILSTRDGGVHWHRTAHMPRARKGEASFAASNSGIFVLRKTPYVWLVTGGSAARVLVSKDFGDTWRAYATPLIRGKVSTGIFSIAFRDKKHGVAVGGDYTAPEVRVNNAALSADGGKTWHKTTVNPLGYRSCVVYLTRDTLIATGPSGTDASWDGGETWRSLSEEGFNVLAKAPGSRRIYLAGSAGRLGILTFSTRYTRNAQSFQQPTE